MTLAHERCEGHRNPSGVTTTWCCRHTLAMGFNPHHQHRRSPVDYVMLIAAALICVALVAWALFG